MSGIKLLLVDDEEEYVRTMAARLALRDMPGRVALSGEEALRAVAAETPDVMVLDLRMPGIDGMAVLERVKREHARVQVIVLTGRGSEADRLRALGLGAFEYLEKPADTGHLLGVIGKAWRRGLAVLKQSGEGFSRYAAAAAMAEEGSPDLALEELERRDGVAEGERAGEAVERGAGGHEGAPGAAGAPDRPGGGERAGPVGLKVMFVDDEEDFVRTLAERMEMRQLGGDVALSGQEALASLARDPPDVMVLDLRMPGLDGLEVLRRVKKAQPRIAVVIMTGHGSEQDEAEAFRLGAFAYLQKPVEMDVLVDTVRRAGRAAGGPGAEAVVSAAARGAGADGG